MSSAVPHPILGATLSLCDDSQQTLLLLETCASCCTASAGPLLLTFPTYKLLFIYPSQDYDGSSSDDEEQRRIGDEYTDRLSQWSNRLAALRPSVRVRFGEGTNHTFGATDDASIDELSEDDAEDADAADDDDGKMRALDQAFKDLKVAEAGGSSCKVCKQELALLRARVRECEGLAFGIGSA